VVRILDIRIPGLLWLIFALALALRLLGAWSGNLMYDEATHLACAETINLHPDHFNLVSRSVDHPPMSVYLVRLSEYLFGDSNLGMRALHALFGALTVFPVFLLASRVFSATAGLWAAGLLAVDQFHLSWSYFIVPEVLLLFFTALVLLQYVVATESRCTRDFVLLGVFLGLAYLAKETALFLAPVLWLSLLAGRGQRPLLLDYRLYLAYLVALLVAAPDIINNLVHFYEGYFYRDSDMIASSWEPSPRTFLLYLGELVKLYTAPRGGYSGTGLQNPTIMHWPAALLYLYATVTALRHWRNDGVRVLLVTFFLIVLVFTVMPSHGAGYNWWWASMSLIPAVALAGQVLARGQDYIMQGRHSIIVRGTGRLVMIGFAGYLSVNAIQISLREGMDLPRKDAATLLDSALRRAQQTDNLQDLLGQQHYLLHVLHVVGPDAELYALLARIALEKGESSKAGYFTRRSLALDPGNRTALEVSARLDSTAE
jgi:4-amino-4-deoxy-L-arabinose transferase-like glycosyltransferase